MSPKCDLTPVEFELMDILWIIGSGTVHDVMAKLPKKRTLAYTSVSTILRILERKQIVSAEKRGKQHIYWPMISKQKVAAYSVKKIVNTIFSGNSVDLVAHLVDKNTLSKNELIAIESLLASKKKELGPC